MIRFLQTPSSTKKIVLGGLLLFICVAMVISLVPGGFGSEIFGQPGRGVIAKVGGTDIMSDQARREAQQMVRQQLAQYGPSASMLAPYLMAQAMPRAADNLIERQALLVEADRLGMRVTSAEVRDDLQNGRYAATFFPGGKFVGEKQYEDMLSTANLTPPVFEEMVGKELLINKLQTMVTNTATVPESDIRHAFLKQNTKIKFTYALLKQDDLRKGLHPTEDELQAYYKAHVANYANSIPEKRKVKYALIDNGKLEATVQVSHQDEQSYYDQHHDLFRVPEQVKVSHILIKTPAPGPDGKVDDKEMAAAQSRAVDVLKQIKAGGDFEALAKKDSEDPGSASQGGSLGWIGRGASVPPEFAKVAFSLAKGQMSDVVKTDRGYHIIRVDDKQDAHLKPLDEVRDQIDPALKQQKVQQMAQTLATQLREEGRSKGIDAAAAAHGLTVVNSDYITRRDMLPGLGPSPQFLDALFLATDKTGVDVAAASQGYVLYELEGVKPQATPTFEDIHSKVEDEFKSERSMALLQQKTQELADRSKNEHDLKKVAQQLGATVKTSDFVGPDGQVPDVGAMSGPAAAAFNLKAGEISGPISSGANGVVLQLVDTQPPPESDYASKRDLIREGLLQQKQQQIFGLYVENLRDRMEKAGKIKINEQEMKALTGPPTGQGM